jgi:hypothetical protein
VGSRLGLVSALGAALVGALVGSDAHAQTPPPQAGPGPLPDAGAASDPNEGTSEQAPTTAPLAPPEPTPAPPAPPPEPTVIVQRGSMSTGNAVLFAGAGAGIAAGVALFFSAQSDDGDAEAAASYEDYTRIETRADRLRLAAIASAGVGVALGVIAIYRLKVSKEGTELSLSPRKGGAALVLERSW